MTVILATRPDGLVLATGARRKPHDPASERYRLTRTLPPSAPDMSRGRYLVGDGWDWRQPVDPDGQGQMGCHDEASEVLTADGWVRWPQYDGRSPLATMHPATHLLEFQYPTARQAYEYDGPLYYADQTSLDFALTPNHRMYVRPWSKRDRTLASSYTFRPISEVGWYVGLPAAPAGWLGTRLARIGVGAHEYDGDDFLALVALVASDGWVGGTDSHPNTVSFCCFRPEKRDEVAAVAARLGFREQPGRRGVWHRNDGTLARWFRANAYDGDVLRSPHKRIPAIVKVASVPQIARFVYFFGDRSHRDHTRQFYTSSPRMADDLQEIMLRLGSRCSIIARPPRDSHMADGRVIRAENGHTEYTVCVREAGRLSLDAKKQLVTERYKGAVFCATVPNGTLITRRNGSVLISGNSCAAFATASAASTAHRIALTQAGATGDVFVFNQTWLYWHARESRNWFGYPAGTDTGSMPEDNLDLLKDNGGGILRGVGFPHIYVADPTFRPPPEVENDPRADYVLSYRPFYPAGNDGLDAMECIATALDAGMPCVVGMNWENEFFNPIGPGSCVLPEGVPVRNNGGHEIWIWGLTPGGTAALCRNSWTPHWTPNAAAFGQFMQPGDFAIPRSLLTGPAPHAWYFHAISWEPVPAPTPGPGPGPGPGPAPAPEYERGYAAAKGKAVDTVRGMAARYPNPRSVYRTAYTAAADAITREV